MLLIQLHTHSNIHLISHQSHSGPCKGYQPRGKGDTTTRLSHASYTGTAVHFHQQIPLGNAVHPPEQHSSDMKTQETCINLSTYGWTPCDGPEASTVAAVSSWVVEEAPWSQAEPAPQGHSPVKKQHPAAPGHPQDRRPPLLSISGVGDHLGSVDLQSTLCPRLTGRERLQ